MWYKYALNFNSIPDLFYRGKPGEPLPIEIIPDTGDLKLKDVITDLTQSTDLKSSDKSLNKNNIPLDSRIDLNKDNTDSSNDPKWTNDETTNTALYFAGYITSAYQKVVSRNYTEPEQVAFRALLHYMKQLKFDAYGSDKPILEQAMKYFTDSYKIKFNLEESLKTAKELMGPNSILDNKANTSKECQKIRWSDSALSGVTRINKKLIDDICEATNISGVNAVITSTTNHSMYVKDTKRKSLHNFGQAVDISGFSVENELGKKNKPEPETAEFLELGDKIVSALKTLGYTFGEAGTKNQSYLWKTNTGGNHYDHIHISRKV